LACQRRVLPQRGDDLARRRKPGGRIRPARCARGVPDPDERSRRRDMADRPEPVRRADGIQGAPGSGTALSDGRAHGMVMPLRRPILLCLMLASGALPAQAALTESAFFDEMPVVLSVSRLSQPVSEAPAAVTVIDRDMIRASGFRDIPDLLRLVPGFSVAYTRDNTWAVGYHGLGDAFSRRFQVLVDGRSIYSPHFGAVHWGDLPVAIEDIERIEVVRGPNAAVYGSNAFLAVINIITQSAVQARGGLASVQYGEHGMAGLVARYGGGDDDTNWRVTLSAQD